MKHLNKRASGILCHISSLPGKYGIGTMGKEAFDFVDRLSLCGQKYWQILPLGPTSYGDSPYQSFSSYAGNPYYIDLEKLFDEEYLSEADLKNAVCQNDKTTIDYASLYHDRNRVFETIFEKFLYNTPKDFRSFCNEEAYWLDDYTLFMTVKELHGGTPFYYWEDELKKRDKAVIEKIRNDNQRRVTYYKMLQYFFFKQWYSLKKYANQKGVYIIGDLPFYVSSDSSDVWANAELFDIDESMHIKNVAGCPPDRFSKDGQKWGNVVYNWNNNEKTNYSWWINRIRHSFKIFDILRIDHFRGFDSFYCVDSTQPTARNGKWVMGPGIKFWNIVKEKLGEIPIIAEDLGFLTPSVKELLKKTGFPGMKVLQFAFSADSNDYLPHNFDKNTVVYTGTHDNDTIIGWAKNASEEELRKAKDYFCISDIENIRESMMISALSSVSNTCILTLQDIIGLGHEARMNTPSTVGENWKWRATEEQIENTNFEKLRHYTELFGRI